ncbi:protein of unknown function DUF820 [Thalassoporum mexicanum PCC 7367]|uniref:Uma2 family endonuclease n=1 Tax=Thalassoporum mexicanum TaxID=3457544 RepID=UPI00029F9008|nr:Uma2 family endonuclease [Pseudanabaena sp. PCC 7367]AFY71705.1 protein of unknown function DUF820 [Pseudanabaena sp. PCC 7367]
MSLPEVKNLIPNLLLAILSELWRDRQDWFFGVNMAIDLLTTQEQIEQSNHNDRDDSASLDETPKSEQLFESQPLSLSDDSTNLEQTKQHGNRNEGDRPDPESGRNLIHSANQNLSTAIIANGLLSLGIPRYRSEQGRSRYVITTEHNQVPQFCLEIVTSADTNAYGQKLVQYAALGVRYYAIYNPHFWQASDRQPLEVYKLEAGKYWQQRGEPFWMPELVLGIGREWGTNYGWSREWLYWYDFRGYRYPTATEIAEKERLQTELARSQVFELQQQVQEITDMLAKYKQRFGDLS